MIEFVALISIAMYCGDDEPKVKYYTRSNQIIVTPDGKQIKTVGEARKVFKKLVWDWDGPGDPGDTKEGNAKHLGDLNIRKTAEANGYEWKTEDWYHSYKLSVLSDKPTAPKLGVKPEQWRAVAGYGFGFYVINEKGEKIVPLGANSYWVMREANDIAKARGIKAKIRYVEEGEYGRFVPTEDFGPDVLPTGEGDE